MSRSTGRFPRAVYIPLCAALYCCGFNVIATNIILETGSNGAAASPTTPINWSAFAGPVAATNAHFLEGHSIPFRLVLQDVSTGYHAIEIEWDTKKSDAFAIDYLTSHARLSPHDAFAGHATAETVDALSGLAGSFAGPTVFPLPSPSTAGSSVAGQPGGSFAALAAGDRVVAIWNGSITNLSFVSQAELTNSTAASRLLVEFEASDTNVVIAWGGHVASASDWGATPVATGATGQPYSMRIISLDSVLVPSGNLGGATGDAVNAPFSLTVAGPPSACPGATNSFASIGWPTNSSTAFAWTIGSNTAGAYLTTEATNSTVGIAATASGSYSLQVVAVSGSLMAGASKNVTVLVPVAATPLTDQVNCAGSSAAFSTVASGDGPFSYVWRKGGVILTNETSPALVLTNLGANDAAEYCVEVTGACKVVTNCATLGVILAPTIACPTNLAVQCFGDIPAPDTNAVVATGAVAVLFVGDVAVTNGCEVTVTRSYAAINSCNVTSLCSQVILVQDTLSPGLVCGTNRVVQCTDVWGFDPPSVTDNCDVALVALSSSTVTNAGCGTTFSATRTWLAVDPCGNSNSCSQTITVVDTVPPTITCSSNIVVECTGGGGATVGFTVTATDNCDTNVLIISTPPSGSFFTLGTNVVNSLAVDACGNSNTCSFTVTVLDTTPPTISCPSNIIAAEFPFDSGGAVVNFAAPVTSDICESVLNVSITPPSGSIFPIGTNTVTCVVADSSGNSNVCTFTIRVIPYRLVVTTNVTTTADNGPGSLRQALLDANDSPGENLVLFNISGPGPYVINLESPLPEITSPVIINGWSQPGFAGLPLITVTGTALSNGADGLVLYAGNSTVRGLVLNGFATGIKVLGGNTAIQGNFIGTDASGIVAAPNSGDGIYVTSARNLIGGSTNWSPNVISANGANGIHFDGPGATNNFVRGNYIGVGADFVTPLGNGADGIRMEHGAMRNSVGGAVINSANGIANNASNGVALLPTAGNGNGIYGNAIFANGALAIDLNADGVTPNDANDSDAGPNGLQNYPLLTDARSASGSLVVDGTFNGVGNATYRLDFYLSNTADPSGFGEGRTHLGFRLLDVNGSGNENFSYGFPVSAVYTQQVTATATDAGDSTSEFSPAMTVRTPPVLETQPVSTNTTPGGSVTLCASASGTAPIYYQWRLNGANIPGATNQCYEISSAEFGSGGSYSVVIYNELGAALTTSAGVQVAVTNAVVAADNFADATELTGLSGETAWSNGNATREPGEPLHANKPGHHSVWYRWTAPEKGVLTLGSRGSDFDTLLGVYRGTNVASLYGEGGDEDRGGYYTSGLRVNVFKKATYYFAVDGYGDDAGHFFFGWSHEFTPHLLPAILAQPQSVTTAPGSNATFTVAAARVCGNGQTNCHTLGHYPPEDEIPNLDCQWLFNGVPLAGETNFSLTVSNVQPANLGHYRARIYTPWQTIESADADLEINLTGDVTQPVLAADKLLDALLLPPWIVGDLLPPALRPPGEASRDTVVRGYTGTQIFSTAGSGTGAADEPICGVLGGASEYITFVPAESGVLFLNTDGSSYDTVMAVFVRNPTNASQLTYLGCDNNGGGDHLDSSLSVPVVAGQTNVVLVDGVNGASGVLQLNYSLLSSIALKSLGTTPAGDYLMQVVSRTNANFSLQRSSNMLQWTSILTTNSPSGVFNYADPKPPGSVRFFYRAQLLP